MKHCQRMVKIKAMKQMAMLTRSHEFSVFRMWNCMKAAHMLVMNWYLTIWSKKLMGRSAMFLKIWKKMFFDSIHDPMFLRTAHTRRNQPRNSRLIMMVG